MKLSQLLKCYLLALLLNALPLSATAYDFMVDGLCYSINSDSTTVRITFENPSSPGYSNIIGELDIPAKVEFNNLEYVVSAIDYFSFSGCVNLTKVTIPNSVNTMGMCVFSGCSNLTCVVFGNSVTSISDNAFAYCTSLSSIALPNSVKSIGFQAFNGCSALSNISLDDSLVSIGGYAFMGCNSLQSIVIPNSVTQIGSGAFYDCSSLENIAIPNTVSFIGDYAFSGTPWFDNQSDGLIYAGSVAYIYKGVIQSTTSLKINEGTVSISPSCFRKRNNLIEVYLPNSVNIIGYDAFKSCKDLIYVSISDSVTKIYSGTFMDCISLQSVNIPNNVTSIDYDAFSGCKALSEITIPNKVISIGQNAFARCANLLSINSYAKRPPIIEINTFANVDKQECVLHVPVGCAQRYRLAEYWHQFINIIDDLEVPVTPGDVNGDENVNVSDVTSLVNMILGVIAKDEQAADINKDGKVNVSDVTALINIILGVE